MLARIYSAPPRPSRLSEFAIPAPISGVETNLPIYNMPPLIALYLYNIVPDEYGLRTREGYLVWAQNIAGDSVNSLIPFTGATLGLTQARLFAVTPNGIFDITTKGTDTPAAVVTFSDQTSSAGFTTYHHVTDAAGAQTIYVADSRNGLYEYNPVGSAWTKISTEITGADPTKIAFVMGHKRRLWFVERDSADAWYLPVGAKAGAAVKFQFGSKMHHGGYLVGLYTYSLDGGSGLDDYLVAISKSGDVMVYQGTDPSQASTWNLVGNWYIGEVPEGRRIAIESGGDLLLLSAYGITSISDLLRGVDPSLIERNVTGKIAGPIGEAIRRKKNNFYWEVKVLSEEGAFVVNSPRVTGERFIQYVLYINRMTEGSGGGWGFWRDIPATTFEPYLGNGYFGTEDGRVCQMQGALDNIGISGEGGDQIEFSMLTGYSDLGLPGRYKQVQFIRPTFVVQNQTVYDTMALYDFNISELSTTGVPVVTPGSAWDIGLWDVAIWSGLASTSRTTGSGGYGRNVAIAIRGTTIGRATLANIEGAAEPWGFL